MQGDHYMQADTCRNDLSTGDNPAWLLLHGNTVHASIVQLLKQTVQLLKLATLKWEKILILPDLHPQAVGTYMIKAPRIVILEKYRRDICHHSTWLTEVCFDFCDTLLMETWRVGITYSCIVCTQHASNTTAIVQRKHTSKNLTPGD